MVVDFLVNLDLFLQSLDCALFPMRDECACFDVSEGVSLNRAFAGLDVSVHCEYLDRAVCDNIGDLPALDMDDNCCFHGHSPPFVLANTGLTG